MEMNILFHDSILAKIVRSRGLSSFLGKESSDFFPTDPHLRLTPIGSSTTFCFVLVNSTGNRLRRIHTGHYGTGIDLACIILTNHARVSWQNINGDLG